MKSVIIAILSAVLAIIIWRELFPPKVVEKPIPTIITKYDTVRTLPEWFQDSVKKWKKVRYITDTVNLVISQTIVDTEFIAVNVPPEQRPDIHPLLSYHGGSRFGDTATVSTFSLRDGSLAINRVFIPGILTDIEIGESRSPKFNYAPFPKPKGPSLLYRVKLVGIGAGACALLNLVTGK